MTHFRGAPPPSQPWADERDASPPFENCVAASGVNLANAATLGTIPTTDQEVQALRKATGDTVGGEGLPDLAKGMRARYGFTGLLDESWATIVTGLVSGGRAFAVIGRYDHLPPAFRTPQPTFKDFHCAYVGSNGGNSAWWVDPLDHSGPGGKPAGRAMSMLTLRAFCASGANASLGLIEGSERPTPGPPSAARPPGATGYLVFNRGSCTEYRVIAGLIVSSGTATAGMSFSSWSAAPVSKRWPLHGHRYTAQVRSGSRTGRWFHVGEPNCSYVEV